MTARYKATELTPSGYGRRFFTERLAVLGDITRAMGGRWRVERQWRAPDGRWRRDGGDNVWTFFAGRRAS